MYLYQLFKYVDSVFCILFWHLHECPVSFLIAVNFGLNKLRAQLLNK